MKKGIVLWCLLALTLSGCAGAWKSPRVKQLEAESQQLKVQVDQLTSEARRLREEKERLAQQKAAEVRQESNELMEAQKRLAESLKQELGDARAKLAMTERGLVLSLLDEIFFDSGKAEIKEDGMNTLGKVAAVLKETVPDSFVAVEGHTDNEPIKYSGWKSNWELSSARALAVVHYFIDRQGIGPQRLRGVACGQLQPVASNDTAQGRRQNRRVEVVILPKALTKEPRPS